MDAAVPVTRGIWTHGSRGRRKQYVDQERYVKLLELENDVLKKWLEITKQEVYQSNFGS
jgi:hypothetical protein